MQGKDGWGDEGHRIGKDTREIADVFLINLWIFNWAETKEQNDLGPE